MFVLKKINSLIVCYLKLYNYLLWSKCEISFRNLRLNFFIVLYTKCKTIFGTKVETQKQFKVLKKTRDSKTIFVVKRK